MAYPKSQPVSKHDLIQPAPSNNENNDNSVLNPYFSFTSSLDNDDDIISIFKEPSATNTIGSTTSTSTQPVAVVYTYKDAPTKPQPLSRTLQIVGYIPTYSDNNNAIIDNNGRNHQSTILSQLVSTWTQNTTSSSTTINNYDKEDNNIPSCQKCHLGVKRTDINPKQFQSRDISNSNSFVSFCKQLRMESKIALVMADKYNRIGFLTPMNYNGCHNDDGNNYNDDDDFDGCYYACYFYVCQLEDIQQYLLQSDTNNNSNNNHHCTENNDAEITTLWKPTMDTNHEQTLWQVPTTTSYQDFTMMNQFTYDQHSVTNNHDNFHDNTFTYSNTKKRPRSDSNDLHFFNQSTLDTATTTTDNTNNNNQHSKFHSNTGAAAADTFYSSLTRSLDTRADSRLYHMRNFNGWVKATQIAELDPKTPSPDSSSSKTKKKKDSHSTTTTSSSSSSKHPLRVLDLACGKGGDLGKWILHSRRIQNYVGIDVARGSLVDAALRARNMKKSLNQKCTFICADLGSDVPGRSKQYPLKRPNYQKLLSWSLQNDVQDEMQGLQPNFTFIPGGGISPTDSFDVVSIQFAIHYMMSSLARARRFFCTVSQLLDVGGVLIATTIDSRVVLEYLMDTGYHFHFDELYYQQYRFKEEMREGNNVDNDEYVTIKVGGGACQLKFHRDTIQKLFASSSNKNRKQLLQEENFGLEYTFTLIEGEDHASGVGQAVDLPEWLVPIPVLQELAAEAGLSLEYASNFHQFYTDRQDSFLHPVAHNALYNMNVLNRDGRISEQEWEISRMYVAIQFRKEREPQSIYMAEEEDQNDEADVEVGDNDMEVNISTDVQSEQKNLVNESSSKTLAPVIDMKDPLQRKKFLMAKEKARERSGDEVWSSLSSDEKTTRINYELINIGMDNE